MVGQGMNGSGEIYDDHGDNNGYQQTAYSFSRFHYRIDGSSLALTIEPAEGVYPEQLTSRGYEIHLRGTMPPMNVEVGGAAVEYRQFNDIDVAMAGMPAETADRWGYDGATLSTVIHLGRRPMKGSATVVTAHYTGNVTHPGLAGLQGTVARFIQAKALLDSQWGVHTVYQDDYPILLNVASIGETLTYDGGKAEALLANIDVMRLGACFEVQTNITGLVEQVRSQLEAQLC